MATLLSWLSWLWRCSLPNWNLPEMSGQSNMLRFEATVFIDIYIYSNLICSILPHLLDLDPQKYPSSCWVSDSFVLAKTSSIIGLPCYNGDIAVIGGPRQTQSNCRADSRFAPNQWETSLQGNVVSHWLGASLESALQLLLWATVEFIQAYYTLHLFSAAMNIHVRELSHHHLR